MEKITIINSGEIKYQINLIRFVMNITGERVAKLTMILNQLKDNNKVIVILLPEYDFQKAKNLLLEYPTLIQDGIKIISRKEIIKKLLEEN